MTGLLVPSTLIIVALGALAAFNYYVFIANETNHTSFPINSFALGFALLAVFAGLIAFTCRTGSRIWLVLSAVAAITAINILAFNQLHVMMDYETWVHGMPERPNWSLLRCRP